MSLIADILLAAGAFGAAFYCFVLSSRLRKFNDLETGMGGAVAVLSAQVDDLEKTLEDARNSANLSAKELSELTARAIAVQRNLELQIVSVDDLVPSGAASKADSAENEQTQAQVQVTGEPMFMRRREA